MATLVLITSFSFYVYIRYASNRQLVDTLIKQAYFLQKEGDLPKAIEKNRELLKSTLGIDAKIEYAPYIHYQPNFFRTIKKEKRYFIQGFFPYEFKNQTYLVLTKDITGEIKMEKMVYKTVIFTNIISLIVIIIYAFFLSKMLIKPLTILVNKLSKMNERSLKKINLDTLPQEFKPLGKSINQLITKIENFIYYKKELFIGAAHELKTPLAVMKTKSQVTLLKKNKSVKELTEAIEQNIKSINNLNSIVESILAFGRAEGAQFDEPEDVDIINLINTIIDEFEIVSIKENKFIIREIKPASLILKLQPMLFRHIFQNLLQNAIKFTPQNSSVKVSVFLCKNNLVIRVKDNGPGLPKDFDLFAPFKRSKNSKGTGLGLFLAKTSADSLGAKLILKSKPSSNGTIATIILSV